MDPDTVDPDEGRERLGRNPHGLSFAVVAMERVSFSQASESPSDTAHPILKASPTGRQL
jgi:hypothetical protein